MTKYREFRSRRNNNLVVPSRARRVLREAGRGVVPGAADVMAAEALVHSDPTDGRVGYGLVPEAWFSSTRPRVCW